MGVPPFKGNTDVGKQSIHYKGIVFDVEMKVDENEHDNVPYVVAACCFA